MRPIYFFLISTLSIFLTSCVNHHNSEKYINDLEKKIPVVPDRNYEIWALYDVESSEGDYKNIRMQYLSSDTTEYIAFNYYGDSVLVENYDQIVSKGSLKFVLNMTSDTCYYYILNSSDSIARFQVGEYCYRFKKGMLSPEQSEYYLENADSLNKVRGDNLEALPAQ
jgi:hypothetical protein